MTRCRGAIAVLAVFGLAACGGEVTSHLVAVSEGGRLCTPAVGDTVLIAHNPLSNDGREEAVLRDVRLVDATNLEVGAFDVLAHDEDGFRGVGPLEPLSEESAVIAVDEEAMVRVAVTLVDPSVPGAAEAFDVEYSDADGRGSASVRTTVTMEVLPAGEFCPEF